MSVHHDLGAPSRKAQRKAKRTIRRSLRRMAPVRKAFRPSARSGSVSLPKIPLVSGGGGLSSGRLPGISLPGQIPLKSGGLNLSPGLSKGFDIDTMRNVAKSTGLRVREAQGGYSYPEIPTEVEQGIPDYYRASRGKRGLSKLPPEAGLLARKIGRYVSNLPADPDNRGTIEGTIAQVLVAAAQEAEAQGDAANARRLSTIAGQWAKRVVRGGGQAPDPDAPLPMAGMGYGGMSSEGRSLPGPWTPKSVTMTAFGSAMIYAFAKAPAREEDGVTAMRALGYGGAAALSAHVLLRVLGYGD